MTIPISDGMNVAAELARLRGEMTTGFEQIKGQLSLISQAQHTTAQDVADLDRRMREEVGGLDTRVSNLEARRIPWPVLGGLSAVVSAAVAFVAFLVSQ